MARKIQPRSKVPKPKKGQSSEDYWRERETRQRAANIHDKARYAARINDIFQSTQDSIQQEIESFYQRYASKEGVDIAEARHRVSKIDMEKYERLAAQYVKAAHEGGREAAFSDEANEQMRLYNATMRINRLEMLKARCGIRAMDGYRRADELINEALEERTYTEYERLAGILGNSVQFNENMVRSIVNASYQNATWSKRLWINQALLSERIGAQIAQGILTGKGSDVLARNIQKLTGQSTYVCQRLMRTELRRVQTSAAEQSMKDNGVTEYKFMVANGVNPCDECLSMDGQVFKLSDMNVGKNAPPIHPQCHCCTAPALDEAKWQRWIDGPAQAGVPWAEFEKETEINYDSRVADNQTSLIKSLAAEYRTRLKEVTIGAQKAAGDVDISGARMRLSNKHNHVAIHEFAHTLANSAADKFGLTNDKGFWKEIKKIRREYMKAVGSDTSRYISSYEHSSRSIDEFMAEAFTHAKMRELGLPLPAKYGGDSIYSQKVLDAVNKYFGKSNISGRENAIIDKRILADNKDRILYFYNGKERAEKYSENWGKASLLKAIDKFALGSSGVVNPDKGKIVFKNHDSKYAVVYDYNGDYFRIENTEKHSRRRYTDLEGNDMANITENGRTRGRSKLEYESSTHFLNSDGEEEI